MSAYAMSIYAMRELCRTAVKAVEQHVVVGSIGSSDKILVLVSHVRLVQIRRCRVKAHSTGQGRERERACVYSIE